MKVMNESPARALLRHRRHLARRLAPVVGAAEAEDLASEAIARGLARPSPDGRTAPWIETIFQNLVRDERRRARRRGQSVPLREDLAAVTATPEDLVLAAERARVVSSAMPAIPGELRDAVVARFFDDQDYQQLAERCAITPTTARTRVHRGLARLRVLLAGAWAWIPTWPRGLVGAGTHAAVTALVPAAAVAVAMFATAPLGRARVGAAVTEEAGRVVSAKGSPVRGRLDAHGVAPAGESESNAGGDLQGGEAPSGAGARRVDPTVARRSVVAPATRGSSARPERANGEDVDDHRAAAAVRHLTFDEDEVPGDLKHPGGVVVTGEPGRQRFESLIEIPASFEPSMTKMIEDM